MTTFKYFIFSWTQAPTWVCSGSRKQCSSDIWHLNKEQKQALQESLFQKLTLSTKYWFNGQYTNSSTNDHQVSRWWGSM